MPATAPTGNPLDGAPLDGAPLDGAPLDGDGTTAGGGRGGLLRRLPRLAGTALQAASVVFVGTVLYASLGRVADGESAGAISWAGAAGALGLALAVGAVLIASQILALRALIAAAAAAPVSLRRAACLMGRTALAKYLPGNVFHYVGRQILAARFGWSQPVVAASSLAEIVVTVAAASAVALAALAAMPGSATPLPWLPGWVSLELLLAAGVLAPVAAGLAAPRLARLPRLGFLAPLGRITPRAWAAGGLCYAAFVAIGGAGFLAILALVGGSGGPLGEDAAGPVAAGTLGLAAFGFAVSYVVGYLTPGAPGGVGIREALLVLLLGPAFGAGPVALAAVLQRLGYVLGEALLFAWALRAREQAG